MNNVKLENNIREALEYTLTCGPRRSILDYAVRENESTIRGINVWNDVLTRYVFHLYHKDNIILYKAEMFSGDDWFNQFWNNIVIPVFSEEEYFQNSTVEKIPFSYEFIEYLSSVLQYKE